MRLSPILIPALLCLISHVASAQDSPATLPDKSGYTLLHPAPTDQMRDMQTDRPNRTNTPDTVDAGHVQIESGMFDLTFSRHGTARNDLFSIGEENIRLGVLNQLELNASLSLYNSIPVPDPSLNRSPRHYGIGDLSLGGTFNLWGNDAGDSVWATSLAIQPQFKIPTAAHDIGNGHFEAFLGFPALLNLPAGFHLSGETIFSAERNTTNNGYVTGWQNMVCVDRVVFEKFDVYAEYWSHITTEGHRKAQQSIDVGVTFAATDSLVIDTGFNFGLNSATADFEWVTGFSVRF